jgi:monovalent cation/hydrogen antiporter
MSEISVVLVLLCLVTLLAFWTRNWSIPYPTLMVILGGAIAIIPQLPPVQLTPDIVFLIFLPPLLYATAWQTSFHDFIANLRPIMLLALGLVAATTLLIGFIAKWLIPDLPWGAAFALGAIVSPPDAIAATSITQRLRIPRRLVVILEGESLLNDASGLVAYRVALAAVAGELVTWNSILTDFFIASTGGLTIGVLIALGIIWIHSRLDDPVVETVVTLLTPYAAYLLAEYCHVSGVLAVVCAGLMVRRKASTLFSSATRLHATAVWDCVVFVLTGLTFIFIGLGLRGIVQTVAEDERLAKDMLTALVILMATILIRFAWMFPAAWLPRVISPRLRRQDPMPKPKHLILLSWAGMRGVVSLAAALALPNDFPKRDLILLIVFVVIFGTLVGQGLTLPWLVRLLNLGGSGRSHADQEIDARLTLLAAANLHLEAQSQQSHMLDNGQSETEYLKSYFRGHAENWIARLEFDGEPFLENQSKACHHRFINVLNVQRHRLHELHRHGLIEEALVQKLEREIDLEQSRIESIASGR